jgi:hypothetical protein
MKVPDGFTVELIAAEPDVVNPVAMTIDERGRYWIAESLEYPRRQPGPEKTASAFLKILTGMGGLTKPACFSRASIFPVALPSATEASGSPTHPIYSSSTTPMEMAKLIDRKLWSPDLDAMTPTNSPTHSRGGPTAGSMDSTVSSIPHT